MTEAYAIKPCPFCGAEAEIVRQGTTRQSMQIACTNCNTQVESGDVIGLTPPEKWHWNNRHPVTVSENGEAEDIAVIRSARAWIGGRTREFANPNFTDRYGHAESGKVLCDLLDAYLSRMQG